MGAYAMAQQKEAKSTQIIKAQESTLYNLTMTGMPSWNMAVHRTKIRFECEYRRNRHALSVW